MKDNSWMSGSVYRDKWKRIFLFTSISILIYFILITVIMPKKYDFIEGDIASIDIKAPRDIIDEEATKEKENEITEKIDKQFTLKSEVKIEASESIKTFFNKLINLKSNNIDEKLKIAELKKIDAFALTDNQYKSLLNLSVEKATELQWVVLGAIDKVYQNDIKEDDEDAIREAKKVIDEDLVNANIELDLELVLSEMCYSLIKPNFIYDKAKTDELTREALKTAPKIMIKKNQLIVREGEPITQKQISVLTELGLLGEGFNKTYIFTCITLAIFVFFVQFVQYEYLKKEKKAVLENTKLMTMILLLNLLLLVLARTMSFISPFIIPIACVAILLTVLLDYKIALVVNMLNLILISVIVGFDPQVVLVGLVSIIVASISLKKVNQRNDILYTTIYITVAVAIVTLTSGILLSNNIRKVFSDITNSALGALLSGILAIGLLPFLESSFNLLTNMKLLELANPNSPLLKRLLMEAPGTYHHSIMVANLAEVAAEEIGANPIIARVGAYYHDIGKIKRPSFFGENQLGGINPHDRIVPNISTSIIISHVKDGLELATEYNIPKAIKDIIQQHHGKTLVKYFYYTAKKATENPDDIKEEDFKYEGPTPETKEAAIVMLADSVEAAVRSINEPTMVKIEEMVNNIIKDKLYSNQLNNCELTFKDLETIKTCFLKVLVGLYHHRIEYPKEKTEE